MKFTNCYVLLLLCSATSAHAANLSGDINGGVFSWNNAYSQNGGIVPQGWMNAVPEAVAEWQPSVPSAPATLTLTQNGGSASVVVPVDVIGVQYNANGRGSDGTAFFAGSATQPNPNVWMKAGSGVSAQFFSKTVAFTNAQTPFTAFKPILDVGDIQTLFRGKPSGVYQGNIALTLPLVYKRTSVEQVTYRIKQFTLPVQITKRSVTCTIPTEQMNQTVILGISTAADIVSGSVYSTKVPLQLNCDSSVYSGTITFLGNDANIIGKAVVKAKNRHDIGVELTSIKNLTRIELNKVIDYTTLFPANTKNYDFSFNAKPVALQPIVAPGDYEAQVVINVMYN
ncbi:fimbrial protein [Photobacterium kishitanii]|uniref:fimbrial protein n=1 Tax=Photobacterium kishitanii TaxID=318456 RepID=UPI000B1923C8|nr:fimbrial protein [Photobacterium kishitanii]